MRVITRSYKTELAPTKAQAGIFRQWAGCARKVYNHMLATRKEYFERTGQSMPLAESQKNMIAFYNSIDYLKAAPSNVYFNEQLNLNRAYSNFFRRVKKGEKPGFPRFKSRHRDKLSFRLNLKPEHIKEKSVKLPKIGWVKLKERGYLPVNVEKLQGAVTVSERAGKWFVSVTVEEAAPFVSKTGEVGGVDLGLKALATLNDGTSFENPKAYRKHLRALKRLQRIVSRKEEARKKQGIATPKSNKHKKAQARLARKHYKIACIRENAIHNMTTAITKRFSVLGIEDLNVKGMQKNHKLAGSVSDAALGEIRRQLEYKGEKFRCRIVPVSRWFPSTQTCSSCGLVKEGEEKLKLHHRTFNCSGCGFSCDRDTNAAINLQKQATTATLAESHARGEDKNLASSELSSLKREPRNRRQPETQVVLL